jgi:hypothetical protein
MKLSVIHQLSTLLATTARSPTSIWGGRSIQIVSIAAIRHLSSSEDKEESLPAHLAPPSGRPIEIPDYLKKGHPYEVSIRPGPLKNDDPRTEEERDKEFWDTIGPTLTAEQAAKFHPDSPYFKKPDDKKDKYSQQISIQL